MDVPKGKKTYKVEKKVVRGKNQVYFLFFLLYFFTRKALLYSNQPVPTQYCPRTFHLKSL